MLKNFTIIDLRSLSLPGSNNLAVFNEDTNQITIFYGLAAFKDWTHLIMMVKFAYKGGTDKDIVASLERAKPEWLK